MINFPLYAIRQYKEVLSSSTGYKIIETAKNKYVLDYLNPDWESGAVPQEYSRRRVRLLGEDLPYELYPINYVCYNVQDMINSGKRIFIDAYGKIITWIPKKYYTVKCYPITAYWKNNSGNWTISTEEVNQRFIVKELGNNRFLRLIDFGSYKLLYDVVPEMVPPVKRKF